MMIDDIRCFNKLGHYRQGRVVHSKLQKPVLGSFTNMDAMSWYMIVVLQAAESKFPTPIKAWKGQ